MWGHAYFHPIGRRRDWVDIATTICSAYRVNHTKPCFHAPIGIDPLSLFLISVILVNDETLGKFPILFWQELLTAAQPTIRKPSVVQFSKKYYSTLDTPKTAGREGVIGNTNSQTVMWTPRRTAREVLHSSSMSILPVSPQFAASGGDWISSCNPSQIAWRDSICHAI